SHRHNRSPAFSFSLILSLIVPPLILRGRNAANRGDFARLNSTKESTPPADFPKDRPPIFPKTKEITHHVRRKMDDAKPEKNSSRGIDLFRGHGNEPAQVPPFSRGRTDAIRPTLGRHRVEV